MLFIDTGELVPCVRERENMLFNKETMERRSYEPPDAAKALSESDRVSCPDMHF